MGYLERPGEARRERGIGRGGRCRTREQHEHCSQPWACQPDKIGPAAHVAGSRTSDTERVVDERLPAVVTEIRSLLDVPEGAETPSARRSSTR